LDGVGWFPRFSPDGRRVAYGLSADAAAAGPSDVWVLDVARAAPTRVTFGGDNRYVPTWTRDGGWVTHADATGATNRIVSTAADGGARADTLLPLGDRRFPTSWSPDGRALAMYVGPQGTPTNSRDVWVLHVDGGRREAEPFVDTPYMDRAAVFSPDGSWMAYVSDKSGRDEVYARPFPGPGPEVTISVGGGDEPVWASSGREIFYRGVAELFVVSVERRGSVLNVGAPRLLFADSYRRDTGGAAAVADYDVSPEGDRFVMVEEPTALDETIEADARLRVVVNFFEELRERVPN
jgi:Tol biopolymer transport system component